jgi:hypothetical protein
MHEGLKRKLRTNGMDGADLLKIEFSCQYDLLKAELLKHLGFLGSGDVELRRGVEFYRGEVHPCERKVLHDEGIYTDFVELMNEVFNALELMVVDDGVERDVNLCSIGVGVFAQAFDVGERIACRGASAILRSSDVNGISSVVDGFYTDVGIACGG